MKENMNLIIFVDKLSKIFMDIKNFYIAQLKKIPKVVKRSEINKKQEDIKSLLNIPFDMKVRKKNY